MVTVIYIVCAFASALLSAWCWVILAARELFPRREHCEAFGNRAILSFLWPLGLTVALAVILTESEAERLKRKAATRSEIEELVAKAVKELSQ